MREATVHLSDEALAAFGVEEFVAAARTAGIEHVSELQCRRPGCLLVVGVREPIPAERLAGLENLAWWERLDGERGVTYLCKLAVPALEQTVDPHHETDVSQAGVEVAGEGVEVTMVGRQEALSERVEEYDAAGAAPLLRTLRDYDGPTDPLDALTPRQREVLETAFEMGHFDVPREATTADVGAALDLDPSTVREHLQRAQRNLLAELLDAA